MQAGDKTERTSPADPAREMPAPRPLPLHLAMQTLTYAISLAALPTLRNGSIALRGGLLRRANDLNAALTDADWSAFGEAVKAELDDRVRLFADGIAAFQAEDAARPARDELAPVWSEGTTTLRRAEAVTDASGPPVLLIPSLVNRAYILDLQKGRSLVRHLAGVGLDTYLVDWDAPGADELGFDMNAYVARLERVLDHVVAEMGQKPSVVGYCMGGNLSLALAARASDRIAALALLATPWNFEAMPKAPRTLLAASLPMFRRTVAFFNSLPVDVLQAMFASLDPGGTARKFRRFAAYAPTGAPAQEFVTLEHWLNDGVPLAGPVALECLEGWYIENRPGRGTWRCGDGIVDPTRIGLAALNIVPSADVIVPPASAEPLGALLPKGETLAVNAGHIGMVAGSKARSELYEPLADWLRGPFGHKGG